MIDGEFWESTTSEITSIILITWFYSAIIYHLSFYEIEKNKLVTVLRVLRPRSYLHLIKAEKDAVSKFLIFEIIYLLLLNVKF